MLTLEPDQFIHFVFEMDGRNGTFHAMQGQHAFIL